MSPKDAKIASHQFLRKYSVEVNDALPLLESVDELRPRDARAIATRIMVIGYVIGIGYGANTSRLRESMERFDLYGQASKREQDLLGRTEHSEQEKINATWMAESVQALAWCLGLVDLDPFFGCDDDLAGHFPKPYADPTDFISNSVLRPFEDIYRQADLHYRLHWAARNARLTGRDSNVSEGLISERRRALDWVIGVEADWDEIPLDT